MKNSALVLTLLLSMQNCSFVLAAETDSVSKQLQTAPLPSSFNAASLDGRQGTVQTVVDNHNVVDSLVNQSSGTITAATPASANLATVAAPKAPPQPANATTIVAKQVSPVPAVTAQNTPATPITQISFNGGGSSAINITFTSDGFSLYSGGSGGGNRWSVNLSTHVIEFNSNGKTETYKPGDIDYQTQLQNAISQVDLALSWNVIGVNNGSASSDLASQAKAKTNSLYLALKKIQSDTAPKPVTLAIFHDPSTANLKRIDFISSTSFMIYSGNSTVGGGSQYTVDLNARTIQHTSGFLDNNIYHPGDVNYQTELQTVISWVTQALAWNVTATNNGIVTPIDAQTAQSQAKSLLAALKKIQKNSVIPMTV